MGVETMEQPVVLVTRKSFDGTVKFLCAMTGCPDEASAIAAFNAEPSDKVEFAWWAAPTVDCSIPRSSLGA
jgi:hypothetical protein